MGSDLLGDDEKHCKSSSKCGIVGGSMRCGRVELVKLNTVSCIRGSRFRGQLIAGSQPNSALGSARLGSARYGTVRLSVSF